MKGGQCIASLYLPSFVMARGIQMTGSLLAISWGFKHGDDEDDDEICPDSIQSCDLFTHQGSMLGVE
jgi:hypothetical protein